MADNQNTADPLDQMRGTIAQQVEGLTEDAVKKRIAKEKEDALKRTQEDGIWGFIKAMIFMLAEWIDSLLGNKQGEGISGWLAKMNGTPIPTEAEVDTVSKQVGTSVSNALVDKELPYTNKTEFTQEIERRVLADLNKNKGNTLSFDGKLEQIAQQSAQETTRKFEALFDPKTGVRLSNETGKAPVELLASDTFVAELENHYEKKLSQEDRDGFAKLMGKKELTVVEFKALAAALNPTLIELQAQKDSGKPPTLDEISKKVNTALTDGKITLQSMGGITLSENARKIVGDGITEALANKLEVPVTEEFKQSAENNKLPAIQEEIKKTLLNPSDGKPKLVDIVRDKYKEAIAAKIEKVSKEGATKKFSVFGYEKEISIPSWIAGFAAKNGVGVPSDAEVNNSSEKMAVNIAGSISDAVTDPTFKVDGLTLNQMNKEQISKALTDKVMTGLRKNESSFGLKEELTEEQYAGFRSGIEEQIKNMDPASLEEIKKVARKITKTDDIPANVTKAQDKANDLTYNPKDPHDYNKPAAPMIGNSSLKDLGPSLFG